MMDSERRSRSTNLSKMSTVSLDSGHVVVELGAGHEARLVRNMVKSEKSIYKRVLREVV